MPPCTIFLTKTFTEQKLHIADFPSRPTLHSRWRLIYIARLVKKAAERDVERLYEPFFMARLEMSFDIVKR